MTDPLNASVEVERDISSRLEVLCKKGVPRNFAKFTGKHLSQSIFFNKVTGLKQVSGLLFYGKRDSDTGAFL